MTRIYIVEATEVVADIDAQYKWWFFRPNCDRGILMEEYKQAHQELIDLRIQKEHEAARAERAALTRICEICAEPLPIRKGRAPKRCKTCK